MRIDWRRPPACIAKAREVIEAFPQLESIVGTEDGEETLVHLTKPLHIAPADQHAPEIEERLVDIVPPLVADLQPSEAVQPR